MKNIDIYSDISARTNGDIYVGVVGPVRTGKSTFIKKFMDKVVLRNIENDAEKQRTIDELPQSASGKQIMTTQPKFVPNKAVNVNFTDGMNAKIRLIDCVGYFVPGAEGAENADGSERMVKTPWTDKEISLRESAEIGTKKVISEHSTISVLVTTDGSFTDISRINYVQAEEKAAEELKQYNKPFVVLLNTNKPEAEQTKKLVSSLKDKYGVEVTAYNIEKMEEEDFANLLEKILYEFPVTKININLPKWVRALPKEDLLVADIMNILQEKVPLINKVKDAGNLSSAFDNAKYKNFAVKNIDLSNGTVDYNVELESSAFYNLLSRECGVDIFDDFYLISYMKHLVYAKKEYDKIKTALDQVKETGYGVVNPSMEELKLEDPEIISKGGASGVKLKASAPSLHIMRVDVQTEVTPALGNLEQSQAFADYMQSEFENNPQNIWNTQMFGKSLSCLVKEGNDANVNNVPEEAQIKMRKTLTKIVNERKGGLICILL